MINKLRRLIKKYGVTGTLIRTVTLLVDKSNVRQLYKYPLYRFSNDYYIHRQRILISNYLSNKFKGKVAYGPFKDFILNQKKSWSKADYSGMLLGIYEKEVLDIFIDSHTDRKLFIDIGAADGYFAVGSLVGKLFKKTYCYETSEDGRASIKASAKINNVAQNIHIFGHADKDFYLDLIKFGVDFSKSVILCDIEGNEFKLFNKNTLKMLKEALIVIEIHDWHKNGAKNFVKLKENASKYFKISEITTGVRDLSIFPEIQNIKDDHRWLICSEGRHYAQTWLKLEPKSDVT